MGHKQGKGGMQACPMNPQMIGMGAKGKWMPNTCWASTCPWPWAREACLLHMGCLAPFGPIDSMPIGWLPHGWLLDTQN